MSNPLLLEVEIESCFEGKNFNLNLGSLSLSPNTQIFKGMPVTLSCLVSDPGKPAVSQYIWYKVSFDLKAIRQQ